MTRHGKNCTAGTVYTYHERKRDTKASGYGTDAMRLGKDSIKEFDCCCLSLQPCRNPVITPDGYLYDKESILEYIVHKKREIAKKMKEYEKQKKTMQEEAVTEDKKQKQIELKKFMAKQTIEAKSSAASSSAGSSVSNMVDGKNTELPSFWIPSLTPMASATKLSKPDEKVRCPMSDRVLKMKDLIPVNFTAIKDDGKKSLITKDARYVCAVTNDVLGNSVPCAVLKTSGSVVTMDCVEKLIKPDMIDPTNSKPLTEHDIIPLQRGATGFSGAGVELKAKKDRPTMALS